MIEIFRKKAGLSIRELYFVSEIVPSTANRDIDVYIQCASPIAGSKPFWTSLADLSLDEDVLFQRMTKNYRNDIRIASNRYGLVVDVNYAPTVEVLATFKSFFNNFAAYRGISEANMPKLEAFLNDGHLVITSVHEVNKDVPLAMHCNVSDGYRVRMYHSATSPRDGTNNTLLGRANKLLHWQTILSMKSAGLKIYDFGGISRNEKLKGIDNFKRHFGGNEIEEYNAFFGVSWLGRMALKTSNLLSYFSRTNNS